MASPISAHQRCRSDKNVHKFQRVIRSSIGANCICVRAFMSSDVKIIKNHIKLRFFLVHLHRYQIRIMRRYNRRLRPDSIFDKYNFHCAATLCCES